MKNSVLKYILGISISAISALILLLTGMQKLNAADRGLDKLKQFLTGSFSNSEQALADSSYYDITLHMCPIWDHTDEAWFYVEQSETIVPHRPFRQQIYKIEALDDSTFVCKVFIFNNPELFVGRWNEPDFFNHFDYSIISPLTGCDIILHFKNNILHGRSEQGTCVTKYRGASYVTTEIVITTDKFLSWDRGFDEHGNQIWGKNQGGYDFRRLKKEN